MKIEVFTLLILISSRVFAQTWITQNSGVTYRLEDICFVDSLYGWTIGDGKDVIATTDGGVNWKIIYSFSDSVGLNKIQFINRNIGFIGGSKSGLAFLMRTIDGGFKWDKITTPFDAGFSYIDNIKFINSDTCWVIVNNIGSVSWNDRKGAIFKTTDGGNSWVNLRMESFFLCKALVFSDDRNGYSFWSVYSDNFDDTYVYQTSDGGISWNNVGIIKVDQIKEAKCIDSNTIWAIGFGTWLSQDGGKNWVTWNWNSPITFVSKDIALIDSKNIWVVGGTFSLTGEGRFYKTNDAGNSWTIDLYRLNSLFCAIEVINKRKVWIVGRSGLILHTKDITAGVNPEKNSLPNVFYLEQNYPNPFNPTTKINFTIPKSGNVKLKVFDVLGREVSVLADGYYEASEHEVSFNASNLPSGIYFYTLIMGNNSLTKKMNLLR